MKSRDERLNEYVRITALLPQAREQLMRYEGVRDVAVGLKETNNLALDEIVFRVYVDKKRPAEELSADQRIPAMVLGVPTDVVLEPTPKLIDDTENYRPLLGGIQIGNDSSTSIGTLGCIARRNSDGVIVALSCHHVMMAGHAQIGEKVGQPEISCCCCCKGNIVAEVVNAADTPLVDAAIAKITGAPGFINEIVDIGLVLGAASLNAGGSTVLPNDKVRKRGRTTELTTGTVLTPLKNVGGKIQQIEIKPDPQFPKFAYKGDSGSAVIDENNVVVGLLWSIDAATETLGYANLITNVTATMAITIIASGTPGTIPLAGTAVADANAAVGADELDELIERLEATEAGRVAVALFRRHGHEINHLLNDDRHVKVAWHRYQGPAFTGHFVKSAREPAHRIPLAIDGVALANLVLRMSVVLQEHGSAALAAAVERNTVSLLQLVSGAQSVETVLQRAGATDQGSSAPMNEVEVVV